MRSFAIWSDNGRLDYGVVRPTLSRSARLGITVVAIGIAALGVRNVFSQIDAPSALDSTADAAATGRALIAAVTEPKEQPQTVGAAPIGFSSVRVTDRVAVPDRFAPAAPPPATSDEVVAAPALQPAPAVEAAEETLVDRPAANADTSKPEETPRVAKKKPRSQSVQVYELPDGRQVTVRRATRNAYAAGSGFEPWNDSFAPRAGRRVQVARPSLFDGPF